MKSRSQFAIVPLLVLGAVLVVGPTPSDAQQEQWRTDFANRTVELSEIVSGGPPKDGIPALDNPTFEDVDAANRWLRDADPVAVVTVDGTVHAYPLQILIWHEIVNDVVADRPVSVTYCPLCNTTLAFDRRFDDRVLDFGTTGRLRLSDLVMYDRQTETWWQQATGEGIVGRYAGEQLTFVAAPLLNWREVRRSYPDARVLSRDTGYDRRYGSNPYEGYDRGDGPIARFFRRDSDNRMPAMERVVAIDLGGESIAVPFSALEEDPIRHVEVGGTPLAVLWSAGTASAVDAGSISEGRDVGSSVVFDRRLDGHVLTFEAKGGGRFTDRETGSEWSPVGLAERGPLKGSRLTPVAHGNHFWFAWAAFKPDTRIVR